MPSFHTVASKSILRTLCWASTIMGDQPAANNLFRTRIWGGPLRGQQFVMAELERLAFSLGTYETQVVNVIYSEAKPGMVAFDLGANAGYMTMVLADAVGKNGQVFSFEPDPRNVTALEANIKLNRLSQVTTVSKAVSRETGTTTFATYEYSLVGHIMRPHMSDDATLQEVPTTCLDDFVFAENNPAPDFIKIDVEGAEELVLLGAERVLREIRPVLIVETRSGWMWDNVLAIMNKHGYRYDFIGNEADFVTDLVGDVLFRPE